MSQSITPPAQKPGLRMKAGRTTARRTSQMKGFYIKRVKAKPPLPGRHLFIIAASFLASKTGASAEPRPANRVLISGAV